MKENNRRCADCGGENAVIRSEEQHYCVLCAHIVMAKRKRDYYAGHNESGWEIQDLWEQLRDPDDPWGGNAAFFLEADEISGDQEENLPLHYRLPDAKILDDYLDEDGHARNYFADEKGMVRYYWEKPQPSRDVYLNGVVNYLDHAEWIISSRADRMIRKLKNICE